jgi:hypothetical protein
MRITYMRCDVVCQYSLLGLILQANPTAQGSQGAVLDDCVSVARLALDMHEQCIKDLRGCENDPFMITKYINWCVSIPSRCIYS